MRRITACIFFLMLFVTGCHPDSSTLIDLESQPDKVELFGKEIVSTHLYERDIAISPRGDEIVFTLNDYRQSRRCLVMITKTGKNWGNKEIMSFSGQYADIEPFYSTDGNKLFFASNRPVYGDTTRSDYNIWVTQRKESGWSDPQPLPSIINTGKDEFYPAVSSNGNLYFTAQHTNSTGGEDIFLSRYRDGQYQEPVPLDTAVNSPKDEFNAYINPDETLLIFGSYGRADGLGGGDLYYSRKDENGNWAPAVNMGPEINSERLDFCPFVDGKRGNFYFTSDRMSAEKKKVETVDQLESLSKGILNGMGNIYKISLESTGLY